MYLFAKTFKRAGGLEVVIVDDASRTAQEVAKRLILVFGAEHISAPACRQVGVGHCVRAWLAVCRVTVIIMDADFLHHPRQSPEFIAKQQSRDTTSSLARATPATAACMGGT